MKYTNFKTVALILSASALLALSGCGSEGVPSAIGIGVTPPPVTPPVPVPVPDAETSTVIASPSLVAADGIATSTMTVTINDAGSNPITDATVTLAQTGDSTISAVTNVGDGTYTFNVNSTTVGTVTYTAAANGISITQTADVTFIGLPANITIDNASLQSLIASILDESYTPHINFQGVINQQGLKISVPCTVTAPVILPAYSTSMTLDASVTEDGESDIVATFSWAEQTLSVDTWEFNATITIDDSAGNQDNEYKAKKLMLDDALGLVAATFPYSTDNAGGIGNLTLKIIPGIADRMFGKEDNPTDQNTTSHMFLYMPVINWKTGKTWLNNNLGANYANTYSSVFNPMQQATDSNDSNAYGSLFQWGRKADGHELITWTSGSVGTPVNATTNVNSDDPTDALFIRENTSPYDWRETPDDTIWAAETSANNVCPVGYRLPTGGTDGELDLERQSWGSNNAAGALASALVLSLPGNRYYTNGALYNTGTHGRYWGSTVSGTYALHLRYWENNATMNNNDRSNGFSVRCLKD